MQDARSADPRPERWIARARLRPAASAEASWPPRGAASASFARPACRRLVAVSSRLRRASSRVSTAASSGLQAGEILAQLGLHLLLDLEQQRAVEIAVKHLRDGRSTCGRSSACCRAARRRARWRRARSSSPWPRESKVSNSCKRHGGQHGAGPGAEILGRDVAAGDLAQVGVHVGGGHVLALAVLVEVLEQLLAGQVLAGLHDPGDAAVLDLAAARSCRSCP